MKRHRRSLCVLLFLGWNVSGRSAAANSVPRTDMRTMDDAPKGA